MRCDDFVCIGRTVPEQSKKYGHRVCCAGYSKELPGLMRVYPLPVQNRIRASHKYGIELVRNEHDSRPESWRLKHGGLILPQTKSRQPVHQTVADLKQFVVPSIAYMNERRMSLGVLLLDNVQPTFKSRPSLGASTSTQKLLFDELVEDANCAFGANAIDLMPYLQFTDKAGSHCLQLREWGCYEWIRKQRDNAAQLWQNLHMDEPQAVVVGNMANHRNVWLVIKTYRRTHYGAANTTKDSPASVSQVPGFV